MDFLDKVPQLDQANGNHVFWGGLGSFALFFAGFLAGLDPRKAALLALAVMLAVVTLKKIYDHFHEQESWSVCAFKIVITVVWPASVLYALVLAHS
jgi:hypothetical protein